MHTRQYLRKYFVVLVPVLTEGLSFATAKSWGYAWETSIVSNIPGTGQYGVAASMLVLVSLVLYLIEERWTDSSKADMHTLLNKCGAMLIATIWADMLHSVTIYGHTVPLVVFALAVTALGALINSTLLDSRPVSFLAFSGTLFKSAFTFVIAEAWNAMVPTSSSGMVISKLSRSHAISSVFFELAMALAQTLTSAVMKNGTMMARLARIVANKPKKEKKMTPLRKFLARVGDSYVAAATWAVGYGWSKVFLQILQVVPSKHSWLHGVLPLWAVSVLPLLLLLGKYFANLFGQFDAACDTGIPLNKEALPKKPGWMWYVKQSMIRLPGNINTTIEKSAGLSFGLLCANAVQYYMERGGKYKAELVWVICLLETLLVFGVGLALSWWSERLKKKIDKHEQKHVTKKEDDAHSCHSGSENEEEDNGDNVSLNDERKLLLKKTATSTPYT